MYAKIFKSLFTGTMRGTRDLITVWVNILANADALGFVDVTPRVIADETGVPIEDVEKCISVLESPDPASRSKDSEGRRLERIDEHRVWGWRIINHEKYRATTSAAVRSEQLRIAQERYRKKNGGESKGELGNKSSVIDHYRPLQTITPAEALVLRLLNAESGASFREVDTHLTLIRQRIHEPGVTLDGIEAMVKRQCKMWKGTEMSKYLRPVTLFGKEKFAQYYDQRDMPVTEASKPQQSFAFQAPKITKLAPHAPIEDGAGIAAALDGKL